MNNASETIAIWGALASSILAFCAAFGLVARALFKAGSDAEWRKHVAKDIQTLQSQSLTSGAAHTAFAVSLGRMEEQMTALKASLDQFLERAPRPRNRTSD